MDPDELGDLFDTIDNGERSMDVPTTTEKTETKTETETNTEDGTASQNTNSGEVTPVEGQGDNTSNTETTDTTATSQTETEAEVTNWRDQLAPAPVIPQLVGPEVDEEGNITNMSPAQYEEYLVTKATNRIMENQYQNYVENAALDVAEQILPELKTDPTVRQLVENQRIAQVVNGQEGDVVAAAQAIKSLLGVTKAAGAQNAKTSITIQKQAAVETGATQTKSAPSESDKLFTRVRSGQGNDEDFAALLGAWDAEGKL